MLGETPTVTLIPTLRPTSTLALLRQRLYRTSEHLWNYHTYTITLHVPHKPITTLRRLLTNVKDNDKPEDRQGADEYARLNAATARPLTLVRPAETLARDWLNTNERQEMVTTTFTLLITMLQTKHQIDWDSATCSTYSTDCYQRLTLKSWLIFTNYKNKHHWIVINNYRHRTNDLLMDSSKTGQPTIIIIKVDYNYHKKSPRVLWGNFLKSLITLTILYVEDCQTTTR